VRVELLSGAMRAGAERIGIRGRMCHRGARTGLGSDRPYNSKSINTLPTKSAGSDGRPVVGNRSAMNESSNNS
jgi:hypothetical protein